MKLLFLTVIILKFRITIMPDCIEVVLSCWFLL